MGRAEKSEIKEKRESKERRMCSGCNGVSTKLTEKKMNLKGQFCIDGSGPVEPSGAAECQERMDSEQVLSEGIRNPLGAKKSSNMGGYNQICNHGLFYEGVCWLFIQFVSFF